jgi:hypothetical protein
MALATNVVEEKVMVAPMKIPVRVRMIFLSSVLRGRVNTTIPRPMTRTIRMTSCCMILSLEKNIFSLKRYLSNSISNKVITNDRMLTVKSGRGIIINPPVRPLF